MPILFPLSSSFETPNIAFTFGAPRAVKCKGWLCHPVESFFYSAHVLRGDVPVCEPTLGADDENELRDAKCSQRQKKGAVSAICCHLLRKELGVATFPAGIRLHAHHMFLCITWT
jgi:hypothetical protein